jgi:hypothetical protein
MPDVPPYIPIAIAALSLLSVEIGTLSPRTMKAMSKMNEQDALVAAKKLEQGNRTPTDKARKFNPNPVVQTTFRLLGIGRGLICITLPGACFLLLSLFMTDLIRIRLSMYFGSRRHYSERSKP